MRKYMDEDVARTSVQAMVVSKLDYANGFLYGFNKGLIRKLQLVQNTAARLISRIPRQAHITPVLKHLHWLPIEARVISKFLVICFKCLNNTGPQ